MRADYLLNVNVNTASKSENKLWKRLTCYKIGCVRITVRMQHATRRAVESTSAVTSCQRHHVFTMHPQQMPRLFYMNCLLIMLAQIKCTIAQQNINEYRRRTFSSSKFQLKDTGNLLCQVIHLLQTKFKKINIYTYIYTLLILYNIYD